MKYRRVAGKTVTALALGLDKFTLADREQFNMLADSYLAMGGSCFDTARIYGGGESEQLTGLYMEERRCRRQIYLSTKIGFPDREDNWRSRLSEPELEQDIRASLDALRTDSVDICWLHRDDESLPVSEIILRMNRLRDRGFFDAFGASNFRAVRIEQANDFAAANGLAGFAASQIQWSAAVTEEARYCDHGVCIMNASEYEAYLKMELPVFCYAPLAGGYFNKILTGAPMTDKLRTRFDTPANRRRAERVAKIARETGHSTAAVTLSYLLSNQLPAVVITGAKKPEHLNESFEAFSVPGGPYGFPFAAEN